MTTQIPNCMNGARTLKILQDGAAPGLNRPASTTGGQLPIARCPKGYKRPNTEYNNKSSQTTLKVIQWNAEGLMMKKTELEHRMNKENIDICCIQETHVQNYETFKVRGYQCFRTDSGGDRRKGGIITLIKSNINAYMSSSSNDGAEQHTVTVNTLKRYILLVNYYCPNNVNLALHNIHVRDSNFIIIGDFNSHSQSWDMTTLPLEERRLKHGRTITTSHSLINHMTHRLSTPDAGTLPVHQTSDQHT